VAYFYHVCNRGCQAAINQTPVKKLVKGEDACATFAFSTLALTSNHQAVFMIKEIMSKITRKLGSLLMTRNKTNEPDEATDGEPCFLHYAQRIGLMVSNLLKRPSMYLSTSFNPSLRGYQISSTQILSRLPSQWPGSSLKPKM
jgi:hypothetical protein